MSGVEREFSGDGTEERVQQPTDLATMLDEAAGILRDGGSYQLTLGQTTAQDMISRGLAENQDKVANANIGVQIAGDTVTVGGSIEVLSSPIGGFKITDLHWVIGNGPQTGEGDGTLQNRELHIEGPGVVKKGAIKIKLGNPTGFFTTILRNQFGQRGVDLTGAGFKINAEQPGSPANMTIDLRGRPAAPARRV